MQLPLSTIAYMYPLELQHRVVALVCYGRDADSSHSGDASATHIDCGHAIETYRNPDQGTGEEVTIFEPTCQAR